jgi:hypothetical protein
MKYRLLGKSGLRVYEVGVHRRDKPLKILVAQ